MKPTVPAPARLLGILCLLAATAALLLGGCGSSSTAPAATGASSTVTAGSTASCASQLRPLLGSLQGLRHRLEVGLSYEQYVAALGKARRAYAQLPVGRLSLGCLLHSGTPGEKALDKYIDAANAWGECLSEAGCNAATIESTLQDEWHVASHFLGETGAGS